MNIINEFFVSFILIKLYFKFKVCRKIKFPLLWKFYFSKWKFYFSADKWILLILSPLILLFIPWYFNVLKLEFSLPWWLPYFLFSNILLVVLVEEVYFRGYLQQRLSQILNPNSALLIASIAFGLIHYRSGVLMIVFASLAGIIYGLAYKYSKSLWISVLFHCGLNLIHLIFFTYPFYLKS